jgi:hypothetical protein
MPLRLVLAVRGAAAQERAAPLVVLAFLRFIRPSAAVAAVEVHPIELAGLAVRGVAVLDPATLEEPERPDRVLLVETEVPERLLVEVGLRRLLQTLPRLFQQTAATV